jgi:hypothetical protein
MADTDHVVIRSEDEEDALAVALIDGKLPIRIEVSKLGIDGQSLRVIVRDTSLILSQASKLHDAGSHRESFRWGIRAVMEGLRSINAPKEQIRVFQHLFDALSDLDRGVIDPSLEGHIENRPGYHTPEWEARACLAAALEARIQRGEDRITAARAISRLTKITGTDDDRDGLLVARRLIEWRSNFQKRKPPGGQVSYDSAVETIVDRKKVLPAAQFILWLVDVEKKLIARAEASRAMLGKKDPP